MRAQTIGKWLLMWSVMLSAAACQPARSRSAPKAPPPMIAPLAMFEVTPAPALVPAEPTQSGVRLTVNISPICAGTVEDSAECIRPYSGEFVITQLNGAEVTRVLTSREGQATIDLPPGKYILGVRTEDIFPLAAPVKVNVFSDQYAHVSLSLQSGFQ